MFACSKNKEPSNTVKPAYNGTIRDQIFSVESRFPLIHVLEVEDSRECESFPLKTGFRCIQVSFKTGFTD